MSKIYSEMTLPEMLREYNGLVPGAVALNLVYRERKCFKDRADGLKSLGAIESSIRAAREGAAAVGSPGLARLRASEQGEGIRQQVLADQAAAAAAVAAPINNGEQTVAKKKEKKEVNGKRGRASAFKDDMKITVLADANPKREGTKSHEWFEAYRSGMLVKTYMEKVGRAIALGCLRWDTGKGFISVA